MNRTVFLGLGMALLCLGCSAGRAENGQTRAHQLFKGRLSVYVVDDFKAEVSKTRHLLTMESSGEETPLCFESTKKNPHLISGMRVEVLGRKHNGCIEVERLEILAVPQR